MRQRGRGGATHFLPGLR